MAVALTLFLVDEALVERHELWDVDDREVPHPRHVRLVLLALLGLRAGVALPRRVVDGVAGLKVEGVLRLAQLGHERRRRVAQVGPVDSREPRVGLDLVGSLGAQPVRRLDRQELADEVNGVGTELIVAIRPLDAYMRRGNVSIPHVVSCRVVSCRVSR